jgi:hypothetical protein
MRHDTHTRRPGTRRKVRAIKTLSAAAWAQVTVAIRQLAQANA